MKIRHIWYTTAWHAKVQIFTGSPWYKPQNKKRVKIELERRDDLQL